MRPGASRGTSGPTPQDELSLQDNSLDELDAPVFHAPGFCGAVRSA